VVAFIASLVITAALLALLIPVSKRHPLGSPFTWGEAMVGATYSFFLMFWVYGVVPHVWLNGLSVELGWSQDKLLFGPFDIFKPQEFDGWFPMTLNYQILRDLVAVLIYVIFLGGQMALWAWWQKRGKKAAAAAQIEPTSDYGRPLVRKG